MLLYQFSQNLSPLISDQNLIPQETSSYHSGLPSPVRLLSENYPNPLVIFHPPQPPSPTLVLDYQPTFFLVVFKMEPSQSPLLQNPTVVTPSRFFCLTILKSIMNDVFFHTMSWDGCDKSVNICKAFRTVSFTYVVIK